MERKMNRTLAEQMGDIVCGKFFLSTFILLFCDKSQSSLIYGIPGEGIYDNRVPVGRPVFMGVPRNRLPAFVVF